MKLSQLLHPLLHPYTNWETIKEGPVFAHAGDKLPIGYYIEQKRTCPMCKKIQLRKITTV